ncbi:RNA polymerase III (C) subunit [Handroanthus impetiginosus]|uniref:DNA-directed RNA polymerase III subunit RPC3 n=1 Tax=Handroanthus impetiginosus TaxID=429701 RepID=A0A2G9HUB6_9LAMI|nr:RNA polymerase III (C) subunit [Handroanthus impetiginosus]
MVSPHGIQLAVHLISSFYGDLCSKVCECLLRRGTLTLALLIWYTELTKENVIDCLRVLIHQNCVQAFAIEQEGAFDEAPRIVTQYMALFRNIIHKYRAPKFMQIVSEELGNDCLEIFQGLIQHGRLSINQIIDRNEQTAGSSDVHVVRESLSRLLSARFIERCPAPEPFLAPPYEEETPAKRRAKSAKLAGEQTMEQRALAAAAPIDSMRFVMEREMDDISEEKGEESTNSMPLGEKRKQDVLRSDEDVLDANRKKEVLWRVNFEEFVCRLRHKGCTSCVKTRINDEAGIVLSAILELSRHSEAQQKVEKSDYLSINAIYDKVIKKEGGLGMDFDRIRSSLAQLGCQSITTGPHESYSIDINGIIEMAQIEEAESVVLRKYGREAYRIFRLLSKGGRALETYKIAETTFVEKDDILNRKEEKNGVQNQKKEKNGILKVLFSLWKDDYLHKENVTTSAAERSLFCLWKVKEALWEDVLDDMYHAALNLRLRIAHEQDQAKELLQLPREKIVGELEKKYKLLGRVRVILESSLMNLDDAIMLFNEF